MHLRTSDILPRHKTQYYKDKKKISKYLNGSMGKIYVKGVLVWIYTNNKSTHNRRPFLPRNMNYASECTSIGYTIGFSECIQMKIEVQFNDEVACRRALYRETNSSHNLVSSSHVKISRKSKSCHKFSTICRLYIILCDNF